MISSPGEQSTSARAADLPTIKPSGKLLQAGGGLILAWTGFQPPNEKVLYLTIGLIVAQVILWYTLERRRFAGPPTGERIRQRQAEIAKIEQRLAG